MSRARMKILGISLFLFYTLSPYFSRHTGRCAASASRMSDYGGGVKISRGGGNFFPSPANRSYDYSPGQRDPFIHAGVQNFFILDPSNAQVGGCVQKLIIPGSGMAPALCSVFHRGGGDKGACGPVIQSTSPGYARTGALITLRGKRLSAQSTENWIHFSESQGSFEDTTGWNQKTNCWVRDNWECWATTAAKRDADAVFDSQVAILGNQSYRNDIHYTQKDWKCARECPGKGEFYNLTWWNAPDADQYYYRYYVRYSGPAFQWTYISWKQLYVHNLFNLNPCMWDNPPPNRGPGRYDIQAQERIFAHLPDTVALERWYCIEVWVKKNGTGVNLKFWLDGEECGIYDEHDQAPQQFPWSKCYQGKKQKLTFGPLELGTTNCQNWKYEQLPIKQSIWFDGFAISSTRIYPASLVEIGNNSDYAKAKKIKQGILHISDTQLQFRVNTTGLDRGPYYIWVTNNKQERSKAYSLRIKN